MSERSPTCRVLSFTSKSATTDAVRKWLAQVPPTDRVSSELLNGPLAESKIGPRDDQVSPVEAVEIFAGRESAEVAFVNLVDDVGDEEPVRECCR